MTEFGSSSDSGDSCPTPKHNLPNHVVSWVVLIGMFVTYAPHIHRLLTKRSAGYSPSYLFLGNVGGQANVVNIVMLQWRLIQCCGLWPAGLCGESLMGIIQIVVQWGFMTTLQVLFILRFPLEQRHEPIWQQLLRSGAWTAFMLVANVVACGVMLHTFGADSSTVVYYAGAIGIASMVLGSVRFLPQIRHTWYAKSAGAISIPGLSLQIPGCIVWVATLAVRPGTNWTTWIRTLLEAILMSVLLSLCIYFKYCDRRAKRRALAATTSTLSSSGDSVKVESPFAETTVVEIPPDDAVKNSQTNLTETTLQRRGSIAP